MLEPTAGQKHAHNKHELREDILLGNQIRHVNKKKDIKGRPVLKLDRRVIRMQIKGNLPSNPNSVERRDQGVQNTVEKDWKEE